MSRRPEVLIIGAGVSGLTTAVCLAEQGLSVRVRTRHRPRDTTSFAAGAIWAPYLVTDDRVRCWAGQTKSILDDLAGGRNTGIQLVHGIEAGRARVRPPAWAAQLEDFRPATPDELPDGYTCGWWYTAPVVDMPVYLDYLATRLIAAGGGIEYGNVSSLAAAVELASLVVNCAGVWSHELVPDADLTPTRGQLVVVENPGIDRFFIEHDESPHPTYFLPHRDHIVLGGSAEPGRTDLAPDGAIATAIRRRCAQVEPALGRAAVLTHRVGLRPSRPRIRLERVPTGSGYVIHNYGHGGAGVTLSWGCAREVLTLVTAITDGAPGFQAAEL